MTTKEYARRQRFLEFARAVAENSLPLTGASLTAANTLLVYLENWPTIAEQRQLDEMESHFYPGHVVTVCASHQKYQDYRTAPYIEASKRKGRLFEVFEEDQVPLFYTNKKLWIDIKPVDPLKEAIKQHPLVADIQLRMISGTQ